LFNSTNLNTYIITESYPAVCCLLHRPTGIKSQLLSVWPFSSSPIVLGLGIVLDCYEFKIMYSICFHCHFSWTQSDELTVCRLDCIPPFTTLGRDTRWA